MWQARARRAFLASLCALPLLAVRAARAQLGQSLPSSTAWQLQAEVVGDENGFALNVAYAVDTHYPSPLYLTITRAEGDAPLLAMRPLGAASSGALVVALGVYGLPAGDSAVVAITGGDGTPRAESPRIEVALPGYPRTAPEAG